MSSAENINLRDTTDLLGSIRIPLLIADAKTFQIVFANHSCEETLGYSKRELLEMRVNELFDEDYRTKIQAMCEVLSQSSGHVTEKKLKLRRSSGRTITSNIDAQSLELADQSLSLFTIHDITEIEQLHKREQNSITQLSHLSKLADIGTLAAGVAHEVNNPLATVKLCIETVEYVLSEIEGVPPAVFDQFQIVQSSIDRISGLTHQMSKLSREEKFTFKEENVSSVLRSILKLYAQRTLLLSIDLEEDIDETLTTICDSSKIEQVLINIFNNAFYALQEIAEERKLKVTLKDRGDEVHLTVWNGGAHIPEEIHEKIFTPFFSDKPIGIGTGLGLPISHSIMSSHGGDIRFTSTPEGGTAFTLVFSKEALQSAKAAA